MKFREVSLTALDLTPHTEIWELGGVGVWCEVVFPADILNDVQLSSIEIKCAILENILSCEKTKLLSNIIFITPVTAPWAPITPLQSNLHHITFNSAAAVSASFLFLESLE